MFDLSGSELLFYGGIAMMGISLVLIIIFAIAFGCTGRKLKEKLEQEYGKPQH